MSHEPAVITRDGLAALIAALHHDGFRVLGPTVRDDAIVYDDIAAVSDLPAGWTDEQAGGHYRLKRRGDDALFGYAVGPHAWKRFLHPPLLRLWRADRHASGITVTTDPEPTEKLALLAVRACELHAIAIQDRVFLQGPYIDPHYKARRQGIFIVAVNCGQAGGTCFCTSMNTGPKASEGFDLALTEMAGEFLVEAGSDRGAALLARLPHRPEPIGRPISWRRPRPAWGGRCGPMTCTICCWRTSITSAGTTSRRAACPAATAPRSVRPASAPAFPTPTT